MECKLFKTANLKKIFDEYTEKYEDDLLRSQSKSIIKLFPRLLNKFRILDLGCGGGYYSSLLASMGVKDITLMDIERIFVRITYCMIKSQDGINALGILGDCVYLPFRSRVFDLIVCVNVIEHIKLDSFLIKESYRILKNGGWFIVTARNSNSLNNLLFKNTTQGVSPNCLERKLRRCGFSIRKHSGSYFIPYVKLSQIFNGNKTLYKTIKKSLKKINGLLEKIGDKSPLSTCGWEHACLCQKEG